MSIHIGKDLRLSDFISAQDGRGLLLDTTMTACVGAMPGLEDLSKTLMEVNEIFDGIVVNPGQAEHLAPLLGGKNRAAPLIRVDWTNAYRDEEFCLPVTKVRRVEISNGEDALRLGASAVVATFFLGFDEAFESENIESISPLARECYELSLPVVVDIRPIGGKVSKSNFDGTVKLGVSFMMEAGVDALIIPDCDLENLKLIANWATVPVLVREEGIPRDKKIAELMNVGMKGILLTEKAIGEKDYRKRITEIFQSIHIQ